MQCPKKHILEDLAAETWVKFTDQESIRNIDQQIVYCFECQRHHFVIDCIKEDNSQLANRESKISENECVFDYGIPKPAISPRYYCTKHESWFCVQKDKNPEKLGTPAEQQALAPIISDKDGWIDFDKNFPPNDWTMLKIKVRLKSDPLKELTYASILGINNLKFCNYQWKYEEKITKVTEEKDKLDKLTINELKVDKETAKGCQSTAKDSSSVQNKTEKCDHEWSTLCSGCKEIDYDCNCDHPFPPSYDFCVICDYGLPTEDSESKIAIKKVIEAFDLDGVFPHGNIAAPMTHKDFNDWRSLVIDKLTALKDK